LSWLDIVLIVPIAISTVLGLWKGLIKAVLLLAGIIIGVLLAGRLYAPLSELLTFIPSVGVAQIVAFAIIFIGVIIVALVLARFLKWLTSLMMLGWVNRLGGAVFGFLLGAIVCGAPLAAFVKFFGTSEVITNSFMANLLLDFFPLVLGLLPAEFGTVRSFFQ
jgi:membrane protein required for colicin V production